MRESFATAELYLSRAAELRAVAVGLADVSAQVALRQVANEYEHMARILLGAAMMVSGVPHDRRN